MTKENKTNEYFGMAPMSAEECLEVLEKNTHCHGEYLKVKRSLKALEIIKEKKVNVSLLLNSQTLADYNEYVARSAANINSLCKFLTQEEFNLLKEVLKNG